MELQTQLQAFAELPPDERVRAADELIEELEQELEQASAMPAGDSTPAGDPRSPDRDEE